jgi:hypothetical protein
MRRLLSFIILVAFLIIISQTHLVSGARKSVATPQTPGDSSQGAKAYFWETTWDFGKIPTNSAVSHTFWIKNVGTDTLKILSVRPG